MRRFDDYSFDTASLELSRDGKAVGLQRQPGRVLELLTADPGTVVRRETLRQQLWAPDTHVDFDRCINFYVRQLRRALGDDASAPRYVETLPGLGYRFIVEVDLDEGHVDEPAGIARSSQTSRRQTPHKQTPGRRRLIAAAVLGLVLGGLAGELVAGSPLDRAAAAAMHKALGINEHDCVVHRWKRGSDSG